MTMIGGMTNSKNTAAHATVTALVEAAAASWTGLDWTSGPQTLLAAIEAGKAIDADNLTEGYYWPANGTQESQALARDWRDLLASLDDVSMASRPVEYPAALRAEAQRLADVEAAHVAERASDAAELGRVAAAHVASGRWTDALEAAEQAATIERTFGDAPAWGNLADAIRALPEYVATLVAADMYQRDQRSDDAIASYVDLMAETFSGDLASHPGLEDLLMLPPPGRSANPAEWDRRYVTAWSREMREWCAA